MKVRDDFYRTVRQRVDWSSPCKILFHAIKTNCFKHFIFLNNLLLFDQKPMGYQVNFFDT